MHPSLRSKRFPVRSSRKLGREQNRRMREKGKGREGKISSFPFSLPLPMFFLLSLHLSRNNSIAGAHQIQLKTQATFTHTSFLQLSGGESGPVTRTVADPEEGPGGLAPPLFLDQTKKILIPAPPYLRVWMTGYPPPPNPLIGRSGSATAEGHGFDSF